MKLYQLVSFSIVTLFATSSCELADNNNTFVSPKPYSIAPLNERAPQANIELHRPFDFPLQLSGNFGELRSNHFHGGIDFKTQSTIGHPIHCADDGYVSQISVSGGGYGRAIYVTHPASGLTTVYGHLNKFAPQIDSVIDARQYALETFAITMRFDENDFPVKKGDIIAYSGNSGYSFGPHLHMEVRHTATGDALDPLPYFKNLIPDNVAPTASTLILYPDKTSGAINGNKNAVYVDVFPGGIYNFFAWGKVYPAIRANDYMTDSHNIYGIKHLVLKVDGNEVYRRTIDRFRMEATRAINTLVDYQDLGNTGNWNMYTRIPQSKPLGTMVESSLDGGAINITEQRPYNCEFIMTDEYGNSSSVPFTIHGLQTEITPSESPKGKLVKLNTSEQHSIGGLSLKFYEGSFYEDIYVDVEQKQNNNFLSSSYLIGNDYTPIARAFRMAIKVDHDTISDKAKYCIARVRNGNKSAVYSHYKNGEMIAYVSRFGEYAVTTDTIAPKINPINHFSWGNNGIVTLVISDNFSGIKNYRGEIDGKWVKFEADNKNATISYKLNTKHIARGKNHKLTLIVTDNCGNTNSLSQNFMW